MVDRLNANGGHYENYLRANGFDSPSGHRRLVLNTLPQFVDRDKILDGLKAYPEMDARSKLISGLVGRRGDLVDLLIVPSECPDLIIDAIDTEGVVSKPDETYVVRIDSERGRFQIPVLVDNDFSAANIAVSQVRREIGRGPEISVAQPELVSDGEFLNSALNQYHSGTYLGLPILRYLKGVGYEAQLKEAFRNLQ